MKLINISHLISVNGGAPNPQIISNEGALALIFYANDDRSHEQRVADPDRYPITKLTFNGCSYYSNGTPNDEARNGHPYYKYGLGEGWFFEVIESELITKLSSYGRFHPYYNPQANAKEKHYVISFKESVFECVASSYEVAEMMSSLEHVSRTAFEDILNNGWA